jgi:hypothetical protein
MSLPSTGNRKQNVSTSSSRNHSKQSKLQLNSSNNEGELRQIANTTATNGLVQRDRIIIEAPPWNRPHSDTMYSFSGFISTQEKCLLLRLNRYWNSQFSQSRKLWEFPCPYLGDKQLSVLYSLRKDKNAWDPDVARLSNSIPFKWAKSFAILKCESELPFLIGENIALYAMLQNLLYLTKVEVYAGDECRPVPLFVQWIAGWTSVQTVYLLQPGLDEVRALSQMPNLTSCGFGYVGDQAFALIKALGNTHNNNDNDNNNNNNNNFAARLRSLQLDDVQECDHTLMKQIVTKFSRLEALNLHCGANDFGEPLRVADAALLELPTLSQLNSLSLGVRPLLIIYTDYYPPNNVEPFSCTTGLLQMLQRFASLSSCDLGGKLHTLDLAYVPLWQVDWEQLATQTALSNTPLLSVQTLSVRLVTAEELVAISRLFPNCACIKINGGSAPTGNSPVDELYQYRNEIFSNYHLPPYLKATNSAPLKLPQLRDLYNFFHALPALSKVDLFLWLQPCVQFTQCSEQLAEFLYFHDYSDSKSTTTNSESASKSANNSNNNSTTTINESNNITTITNSNTEDDNDDDNDNDNDNDTTPPCSNFVTIRCKLHNLDRVKFARKVLQKCL